ncbi:MAG: hypothetical protein QXO76_01925 [Thermoproteota archaeon]
MKIIRTKFPILCMRGGGQRNKIEGKPFSDSSNKLPEESEEVLERLKMIPPGENYLFVKETKWRVEGRGMSLIY